MEEDLAQLKVLERSFVNFVYPFQFDSEEYPKILEYFQTPHIPNRKPEKPTEPAWKSKKHSWIRDCCLSPVSNYLNIDSHKQSVETKAHFFIPTDRFKSYVQLSTQYKYRIIAKTNIPIEFHRSEPFEVILFPIGIGFLIFKIKPCNQKMSDYLNIIHYLRFTKGQRGFRIQGSRRTRDNNTEHIELKVSEIIESHILNWNKNCNLKPYQEIFVPGKMLVFFGVLFEGEQADLNVKTIYRLSNFFNSEQPINPGLYALEFGEEKSDFLPYAQNHGFLFSLEGGGFYGYRSLKTQFFTETLIDHLQNQYFLLFILALHQRFALIHLSEEVAENWKTSNRPEDIRNNMRVFQKIRDQLLLFTARGYFLQVMQQDNHHRCYCKWREMFQLDALYTEVNGEVQEMHEYCLMQRDRQLQDTVYYMSAGLGSGAIVASTAGLFFNSGGQSDFIGAVSLSLLVALITAYSVKILRETQGWQRFKQALIDSFESEDCYGCDGLGAIWRS